MSSLRALSALATRAARAPALQIRPRAAAPLQGLAARARALAAEPGYLDRAEVMPRVLEVVRKFEKVQPEKVAETSHFVNDLGLDSLDAVELVMALEDEFGMEIADADAEKILSCKDAVDFLSTSVNAK